MNLHRPDRPLIMGVLNLTPDSFSDGGDFIDQEIALQHAINMADEGADIIDVGGESTRPDSARTPPDKQKQRVVPVIKQLRKMLPSKILISIDTSYAGVAAEAIEAGAAMINDISAGNDDENIFKLAAEKNIPIVLMHMQGTPATMQDNPQYKNVVEEIREYLIQRALAAQRSGISKNNIIIDPGIGFGKTKQHNLKILENLNRFVDTDYPVLLGASRKRFMKAICKVEQYKELTGATCATTALGVLHGVSIFRVHDVKENKQTIDLIHAINNRH